MNKNELLKRTPEGYRGILLVDKPKGKTSFSLVAALRKRLHVKKIGHAGTLDPFASGVMVLLVGREYTRLSDSLLTQEKEYQAKLLLGITTDTFDCEGEVVSRSNLIPDELAVTKALLAFQGEIAQVPPMYSAKKINGVKLYHLARKGVEIPRQPVAVTVSIQLIQYAYPYLDIHVTCSKGTYIRSLAHDIGNLLGCGAHLQALRRLRSGDFKITDCIDGSLLYDANWQADATQAVRPGL